MPNNIFQHIRTQLNFHALSDCNAASTGFIAASTGVNAPQNCMMGIEGGKAVRGELASALPDTVHLQSVQNWRALSPTGGIIHSDTVAFADGLLKMYNLHSKLSS
jgi:hypothetical protein